MADFYGEEFFPRSPEQNSFITSFVRIATDDNKKALENVQSYIDVVLNIPHYEVLNVQVLWTAFLLLSRPNINDKVRSELLERSRAIHDFFYEDEYSTRVIAKLLPAKSRKDPENQIRNLQTKLTAEVYSYIRLILTHSP